ncbi:MAG: hypothetical protein KBD15_00840 [Candidatus Magasanikbacteria bacterium]|jgi:hypothetical protein|nr:hypothetical protein [Candidatus Magasanikbacteria bacterium]
MQKKILQSIFLGISAIVCLIQLGSPVGAYAQYTDDLNTQLGATVGKNGADIAESKDPRLVAALLIRTTLSILGTLFLVYAVYGGYQIMTAAGDSDKVTKGKTTIVRASLGLLIILSSYSITLFVTTKLLPLETQRQGATEPDEPFDAIERGQREYLNTDPLNEDINVWRN